MSRVLLRSFALMATFILTSSFATSVQPQGEVDPALIAGHRGLSHHGLGRRVLKLEHKVHQIAEMVEITTEREYDLTLNVDGPTRRYKFTTIRGPGEKGDKTELIVHRIADAGNEKKYDLTFRSLTHGDTHQITKDYLRLAIRHDREDHKSLLTLRHRLHALERKMLKLRSKLEHIGDKIIQLIVRTVPMMGGGDPIMKWEFHESSEKYEMVIHPIPTTTEGERRYKLVIHPIYYTKDMLREPAPHVSHHHDYENEYLIRDIHHKLETLEPMAKKLLEKAKPTKEKHYGLVVRTTPNVKGLEPVMRLKFNAVEEDDTSFAFDVRQVAGTKKESGEVVRTYELFFHGARK